MKFSHAECDSRGMFSEKDFKSLLILTHHIAEEETEKGMLLKTKQKHLVSDEVRIGVWVPPCFEEGLVITNTFTNEQCVGQLWNNHQVCGYIRFPVLYLLFPDSVTLVNC